MSDVGYTDTPYGRCPIKSIRTLATPLITPLVQEFHHLSSSSSSCSSSSASLRELDAPFFPPWIGGGGRIYPWTDRIVGGGDGIRLSGRSVSGGGAVHARWFLERLVMPRRDVSTARWDRGWGTRGQVIIPGCLSRSLRGQRWITNGKRPCVLPRGRVTREGVDWK